MHGENSRDKVLVDLEGRIANLRPVTEDDPDHLKGRINSRRFSGFLPRDYVPKLPHLGGTPYVDSTPKSVRIGLHKYSDWKGEHMYDIKLMFLQSLLRRSEALALYNYGGAMRKLVDEALNCYEPPTAFEGSPNPDQFMEMLLLDSCFLVELFRKHRSQLIGQKPGPDDPFHTVMRILEAVQCDLVSFQNQLPFSVLQKFFEITKVPGEDLEDLIELALNFFRGMADGFFPMPSSQEEMVKSRRDEFNLIPSHPSPNTMQQFPNLLGLLYYSLPKPSLGRLPMESVMEEELIVEEAWGHMPTINSLTGERAIVNSATELDDSGIRFKKVKDDSSILNIKFGNGKMLIPHLKMAHGTLTLLVNLSEYEKQFPISHPRFVNEYLKFMQCLVNSPKDAELLRQNKIIESWVGHDGIVCAILNDIASQAKISPRHVYHDVSIKVNEHCSHRRKKWMAKLRSDYFNSPWSLISFLAALFLIVLTVTQTVFAILSYVQPPT